VLSLLCFSYLYRFASAVRTQKLAQHSNLLGRYVAVGEAEAKLEDGRCKQYIDSYAGAAGAAGAAGTAIKGRGLKLYIYNNLKNRFNN